MNPMTMTCVNLDARLLKRDRVLLRCEGLDTFATVMLNGRRVGKTNHMFRTWEWDVKSALRPGRNRIRVDFASTLPYIAARKRQPIGNPHSATPPSKNHCDPAIPEGSRKVASDRLPVGAPPPHFPTHRPAIY